MFGFFGGFRVIDGIANEIGADPSVYRAALTEAGVNFAVVKHIYKGCRAQVADAGQAKREIGLQLLEPALNGLLAMQMRFPDEPAIQVCRESLYSFAERNSEKS